MIVKCQNCQKKYKFDPAKLKSNQVAFTCKNCGHRISLNIEENPTVPSASSSDKASITPSLPPQSPVVEAHNEDPFSTLMAQTETDAPVQQPEEEATAKPISRKRYGLKVKMFALFFVIPLSLVVIASTIFLWQLDTLTEKISVDSHAIVAKLSQERVNDMARMVANQCKLYLNSHTYLSKEDFNKDPEFRALALQKVGETGYTCIYEIPDSTGKSGLWVHPNEKIIGIDLPGTMQKAMGSLYQAWMAIYQGAYKGQTSSGYYKWKEKDGSLRDKYMTCTPVKGTPYVVAATTYVDEINREAQALKLTAEKMTQQTRYIVFAVFGITILLMGSIVLFYSGRLRNNLATLTEAAEKISVGELNTEIQVRSNDEISDLGEAIGRMQESIRLSIERLRRRR
jgi:HAMP domain-containing protein/DNA-directed RNA polymerase subunit RPC12/RpoP